MLTYAKLHPHQIQKLSTQLPTDRFDDLSELKLAGSVARTLLYPTDDLFLTAQQWDSLHTLIGKDTSLNVVQAEFDSLIRFGHASDGFYAPENTCYRLTTPTYEE